MTNVEKFSREILKRKAVVYVRQSTQAQVLMNIESQRRQYDLVQEARRYGFCDVEVIDDDLGRSASGTVSRPGFERLVALVCTGGVGAVFCLEASRLSRNGKDWHHLLTLCGITGALVVDLDGIYDPGLANDRLLLGMKGSISEFELNTLRLRMNDAKRQKAKRGELRIGVPIGYIWDPQLGIDFTPDARLREIVQQVFIRFRQLGSGRQVYFSMKAEGIHFPRPATGKSADGAEWALIRYRNVISLLTNPFYAGVYAYGTNPCIILMTPIAFHVLLVYSAFYEN